MFWGRSIFINEEPVCFYCLLNVCTIEGFVSICFGQSSNDFEFGFLVF